jgi:MFS family permease
MNLNLSPFQRWLRRKCVALLQADRPVPPRSEAEVEAEMAANYRWNFTANLFDGAAFWFGMSFISSSTIVPLFVSKLTPSRLAIGLVAVIASGGWFLPQLFTANLVERLPRKKPVIVNLGLFLERLPVWVLAGAALLAGRSPGLALGVFFVAYAWRGFGAGTVATAWQDLLARCFPANRRGRVFGLMNFLGAAAGAGGAALSTWLLEAYAFPSSFVALFALAAVATSLSWIALSQIREPAVPVTVPRQSNRQFLAKLPAILRQDHNFRRYLLARSVLALGGMGGGFITVAAVQRWQVPDGAVGLYTAAFWLGQTFGNLTLGLLADRFGHKLSLEVGALTGVLAFAGAWLAPTPEWIYVVFLLQGINLSSMVVSGVLVTLEFCEPERRPTYAGLANTVAGVVNMLAPLLGAWLAGVGYSWVFALSAVAYLVALMAMHWLVKEPRWAPAAQVG